MLLEHIEKPTKWLLADLPPLRRWSSASGKIVLVGDAAHAMLPFLAQGAAQAIESSAVLAICLARVSIAEAIPEAISAYEAIRKPRVKRISFASRENGNVWHLEERPEQDARDAALKMGSIFVRGRFKEKGPRSEDEQEIQMELATGKFQARVFGFDAISDANDKLEQMGVPSINRP
ncbi:MAG: hypothetical protein MMC23_008415 [Stictis urceolatum]|nr:hypothetical protein [Stictis urceolata]